jgi:molybdopterin synthase catalytic subunit
VMIGTVRDHAAGTKVESLRYEAYAAMAVKIIDGIVRDVEAEHDGVRGAVDHRVGHLAIGDRAVVVAASSPHRGEAFAACQRIIDRLKEDAPIWKHEHREGGVVWVGLGP